METIKFPLIKERNKMSKSNSKSIDSFFEVLENATDRLTFDGNHLEMIRELNDIDSDLNKEQAEDLQQEYRDLAKDIKDANDRRKEIKAIAVELGYGHLVEKPVKEYTVAARVDMILKWGQKK
mgnify:CR=1 FL=1